VERGCRALDYPTSRSFEERKRVFAWDRNNLAGLSFFPGAD